MNSQLEFASSKRKKEEKGKKKKKDIVSQTIKQHWTLKNYITIGIFKPM